MVLRVNMKSKVVVAIGLWLALIALLFSGVTGCMLRGANEPSVVRLEASMDEVAVPLVRAASRGALEDYGRPSIDFEDHGWIGREPVEEGLGALPEGVEVQYYGAFQLSQAQFLGRYRSPEEIGEWLWDEYDYSRSVDSKVSFINGLDAQGRAVFYFDSDNDEELADEEPVLAQTFGPAELIGGVKGMILGILPAVGRNGIMAASTVQYEYLDGDQVRTASAPVEVYRYDEYRKSRPASAGPKFRGQVTHMRRGQVYIEGELFEVVVDNDGEEDTYHGSRSNRIVWDLDGNGTFDNDRESAECFRGEKAFQVGGVGLRIKRISPSGDLLVLERADAAVKVAIEPGVQAPEFAVRDMDGATVQLTDWRGTHVLLDFWSTGCGPCLRDTPELKALAERYGDQLVIVGISDDYQRAPVERYIADNDLDWIQILDRLENDKAVRDRYHVSGFPRYILIDPQGRVLEKTSSLGRKIAPLIERIL